MVFLCAAELFIRRAAAGVFFRRAVAWSVHSSSCGEFVRRAAVGLSSSCGEFVRRAAVGLSSSCCRECSFVELLSECSLVELLFGTRNSRNNEPSERCRSKQSSEEAVEAMPKTIARTLSRSEMAPPFHRTCRISLNYCAAYFFRKDGVCVVLAYFFPGRVRRLFLPGTLQVRSKHVNDTVRYGNFFLTPTVTDNLIWHKLTFNNKVSVGVKNEYGRKFKPGKNTII